MFDFDYIKRQFSLKATHKRTKEEVQQRNLEKKNDFFKFMIVVCIVGINIYNIKYAIWCPILKPHIRGVFCL